MIIWDLTIAMTDRGRCTKPRFNTPGCQGCFTIYPKNPDISDGMQMERLILSPRTAIMSGKRDFSKGRRNFVNRISELRICVPFTSFLLDPGSLYNFIFFWKKSTNRFFRVNGKQPRLYCLCPAFELTGVKA